MKLTLELKEQIDNMSYETMFNKWRFAPTGDPMFQGESGDYYTKVFREKRNLLPEGEHTRVSKMIGW